MAMVSSLCCRSKLMAAQLIYGEGPPSGLNSLSGKERAGFPPASISILKMGSNTPVTDVYSLSVASYLPLKRYAMAEKPSASNLLMSTFSASRLSTRVCVLEMTE